MRILMLGWEFPPYISGGLGTACYGLTKALDRLGHSITFVLPKSVDQTTESHVELLSPETATPQGLAQAAAVFRRSGGAPVGPGGEVEPWDVLLVDLSERIGGERGRIGTGPEGIRTDDLSHVTFHAVPSNVTSPYRSFADLTDEELARLNRERLASSDIVDDAIREELAKRMGGEAGAFSSTGGGGSEENDPSRPTPGFLSLARPAGQDYSGDLMGDVRRYAKLVVALSRGKDFDVIHAHDWLTYPAGMAVARLTGIPLVVHVHSTEFDRSGESVNQVVYDIERRGMHSAMRVITVSYWTKNIAMHRYGVEESKIRVVWNGVDQENLDVQRPPIGSNDKIVLFLGRITMQKGPEYFIQAAKRVLEKIDNVKFIVAGSGDMAIRMIEMAASMGIGHKILFTGFLRGDDVARVFRMADCYVMPSVSEPFGIAPLEAMSHSVPVIISKQSGVSEVLTHALKVDFWDIEEMANKIVAVLKYPPLSQTMRHHGQFELRRITWDGAAKKCAGVYADVTAGLLACV